MTREKKWKLYHKFEEKNKKHFLRRISTGEGFNILKELHNFARRLGNRTSFKKIDKTKIITLTRVHSLFNKVKS